VPRPFTPTTDTAENRWKWVIITALLLVITVPYVLAAAMTPAGTEYQWLLYNPDDQNVHLGWAKQAARGQFFFSDLFTTESLSNNERPLFNNLFSWVMGVLTLGDRLPLIAIFHGLRLLSAVLILHWFHLLVKGLTDDRRVRVLALFFAAFSMGAGWMRMAFPAVFGNLRLVDRPDLTNFHMMPEAYTFASVFIFPLFAASMAVLVLIYLCVLRAAETNNWRYSAGAGLAAMLLANIHTYDAIPLNVTMLLWAGYNWRQQRQSREPNRLSWLTPLIVIAGTLPPLLYQIWVFTNSTEFRLKAQTPTPPPGLHEMLLSYAPLILFVVPGMLLTWRQPRVRLLALWVVVTMVVIYAPLSFGRKMIEGTHLPLCFFGAVGLVHVAAQLRTVSIRRAFVAIMLSLCCISSYHFATFTIGNAKRNNDASLGDNSPPLYLTAGDAGAMRFLAQPQYRDRQAVLCIDIVGNYVPHLTGKFTYAGHWAETLAIKTEKLPQLTRFFEGKMTPDEARAWLRANHIGYILAGHFEQKLNARSGRPALTRLLNLPVIYSHRGTVVYRIPPERN